QHRGDTRFQRVGAVDVVVGVQLDLQARTPASISDWTQRTPDRSGGCVKCRSKKWFRPGSGWPLDGVRLIVRRLQCSGDLCSRCAGPLAAAPSRLIALFSTTRGGEGMQASAVIARPTCAVLVSRSEEHTSELQSREN